MQIYLDYSATTPPRREVIAAVQDILQQEWGNPSSLHEWGQRSAMVVEQARMEVAELINAPSDSIIFTSGGTESDNLAIMGVTRRYSTPQHIIISSIEHSAVAEPARLLESWGWQVTRLPVDKEGRINPKDLEKALQPNTVLVSIIYGQSEVGTLQPIETLGKIIRDSGIIFHIDAVQVAGRLPIDVQQLPVDLLSISSHKIYGIQGAGALYIRDGVKLVPLLLGGSQESGLRSGTQAVPAIVAFGVAAELAAAEMVTETPRLIRLRDRLFDQLADTPFLKPTGSRLYRLPHHVSFTLTNRIDTVTGKTIVRQMNLAGIGISGGSACHSGKLSPSPILLAMGYGESEALGGIRLTLGRDTTEADVDWTAIVLKQVLKRLMPELVVSC
ncbi:MAG TPA: cysteine desulfurase [Cyanobacteria bacterium UBA11149]|nr:cysteine desulfurase [Cyanobacteria bacterium UBA11367]HBE58797.1 cysteine desulfurase [Cyanobacteria bacterium UBA11366]HBK64058.1 cysteine desulfurase [Cyanobacteria bacterium UBA11166]HBR75225.1 cysteine desulfurase [Cyanobacteria bacterium UBA11159]HBS72418.1 cysteine desulfurase [Cyanobacteria bacterium UBA11153]HBW89117.1 cysteine desulfurase [Cyanobacteria bacterium UBA11149]HCA94628.1 cysteine desulfurase [Cyanobacteria bacterium UBA9226]